MKLYKIYGVALTVFAIFALSSHVYHLKKEKELKQIIKKQKEQISQLKGEKQSLIASIENLASREEKLSKKKYQKKKVSYRRVIPRNIPYGFPLKGVITSKFGYRPDPFTGVIKFHSGIDIKATYKQPVRATADGIVKFSGWKKGYGKVVIIKHKNGYETWYAHLAYKRVGKNQPVRAGQIIGYAGRTGRTTGVHLHYEIRKNGKPVNPLRYIYVKAKYTQEKKK